MVAILLRVRQYTVLYKNLQEGYNMNPNQDDKTTAKHLMITFILFVALGVFLIIGANIVG